jgi:methylated-DNA-[protein]-cysteine S-methyltransferase
MKAFFKKTESPIGMLYIASNGVAITSLNFERPKDFKEDENQGNNSLLGMAEAQLVEFFDSRRTSFDLPLAPAGTEFQKSAWLALTKIPFGKTSSYQSQAESIGRPKAMRAIGVANSKNPIAIIIPCHRVIGKNGSLTGYAGGLNIKKFLLDLEQK